MKVLIDTHTYIWYINGDRKLSKKSLKIIDNKLNEIYISIASIWEISIKVKLGKLKIKSGFKTIGEDLIKYNFLILPISIDDLVQNYELQFHHKDPFDRIIISQSIQRKLPVISCDILFDKYNIERIW